jgi:CRISPR-associated endoribonuclease Cas6
VHITVRLNRVSGTDPPYDHNYLLGSAVYAKLRERSEDLAEVFHDSPRRAPYVLSEIHRVTGKPREAWFRVGTDKEAVRDILLESLAPGTNLRVGPTTFHVESLHEESPLARPGAYVTLSPILLRDPHTKSSLVSGSPGYLESLEMSANMQVWTFVSERQAVFVRGIEPQGVRKRTINETTVLAQKGRLLLEGDDQALGFLVNRGLGSSPALGFGMIVRMRDRATGSREPEREAPRRVKGVEGGVGRQGSRHPKATLAPTYCLPPASLHHAQGQTRGRGLDS